MIQSANMSDSYEKLGIIGTLVALGGAVIRFLLNERKEMAKNIEESQKREREFRDSRTEELLKTAEMMSQSDEVIKEALSELTRALENLEKKVEECGKK